MPKKTATPDAIALLEEDHTTLRGLLAELQETPARAAGRRRGLLAEIGHEFRVHAQAEEELFYPAFRLAAETGADEELFLEAGEEHGLVHVVLTSLEKTDPASDFFAARVKVLKDLIEHHMAEEEREMFPRAKELIGARELEDLAEAIEEREGTLRSEEFVVETLADGSSSARRRRAAAECVPVW